MFEIRTSWFDLLQIASVQSLIFLTTEANKPNAGVEFIQQLPKWAWQQSRGFWVFSSPIREALRRNGLATEERGWREEMRQKNGRRCVKKRWSETEKSNRWVRKEGEVRNNRALIMDRGFFWFRSLKRWKILDTSPSAMQRTQRGETKEERKQGSWIVKISTNELYSLSLGSLDALAKSSNLWQNWQTWDESTASARCRLEDRAAWKTIQSRMQCVGDQNKHKWTV